MGVETVYRTSDGEVFVELKNAEKHESEIFQDWLNNFLISPIELLTAVIDPAHRTTIRKYLNVYFTEGQTSIRDPKRTTDTVPGERQTTGDDSETS